MTWQRTYDRVCYALGIPTAGYWREKLRRMAPGLAAFLLEDRPLTGTTHDDLR